MALAGGRSEVFAGSELETYLRNLQLVGRVPLYPWSVRSFSPRELDRLFPSDSSHPWAGHYDLALPPSSAPQGRLKLDVVRPTATIRFNSAFPYGSNDGPIWAGRGLTSAVQAGLALRYGALSLTVAPIAFRAENADFSLMANGNTGMLAFA